MAAEPYKNEGIGINFDEKRKNLPIPSIFSIVTRGEKEYYRIRYLSHDDFGGFP